VLPKEECCGTFDDFFGVRFFSEEFCFEDFFGVKLVVVMRLAVLAIAFPPALRCGDSFKPEDFPFCPPPPLDLPGGRGEGGVEGDDNCMELEQDGNEVAV